ncbi:MAG: MGMT family protein [Candidatus Babeliales bacterium]
MEQRNIFINTPAGILKSVITPQGITSTLFVDALPKGASIQEHPESLRFALTGTPLQVKVWHALQAIPVGKTVSYQELAIICGYPRAWRAVANAVGKNPISYFIPCHRVIRKDGTLGGYAWGLERKRLLLHAEKITDKKS